MQEYDEQVIRDQAAYRAHEQMYRMRHPFPEAIPYEEVESKPQYSGTAQQNRLAKVALLLMTLASIVVSGSRTIPEFGGDAIGAAAFFMIEVGIMTYAYLHTLKSEQHHVTRYIKLGIVLALTLALAANFNHEAGSKLASVLGSGFSSAINFAILILLGVGAPALAYINGDVLAMLTMQDRMRQQETNHDYLLAQAAWASRKAEYNRSYRQSMELWRDGLNESFSRSRSKIKVERERPALPPEIPEEPSTDVTAFVRQLLSDPQNQDLWQMSSRKLAEHILQTYNVPASKSTVNKVMNELRGTE